MGHHKVKQASVLFLLTVFLACTFWGCARPISSQQSDGKIELEFWTLQMLNFSDYINGRIAQYEALHPQVHIKWVDVPFSEGEKKALTSMLAQKTPDIINLNPDFSAILASRGALLNLNDWISPPLRSSYLPVSLQAASLDTTLFGLPWYLTSAVTMYNKPLFEKAGLTHPPTSYAELATMAPILKAKTGSSILMPDIANDGRFFRDLLKQSVPIWDQSHHLVFADHQASQALAYWVQLYRQGWVPPESLTETQQAAVDRYQAGTLGLLLTGPNFLNLIKENAPDMFQRTQVAPQFPAQSSYIDFAEMLLVVPKRTPHPKEAVDFALFMTNPESTLALANLAPVLPPHAKALQTSMFTQTQSSDVRAKARSISAQQLLKAKTAFQISPYQKRLNQLMDYYVQSALLGKLSPEAAMAKAQSEMNALIQE